jgi:hypothetical protein
VRLAAAERFRSATEAHLEGQPYFRFDVELTPERNPPGLCDRLREDLRAWIIGRGLDYGMGALGGSRRLYGEIGPNPPATEGDRAAMADWLRGQRMHATVRLEAVVPFSEAADMRAPVTDWVFTVNTLTEAEQAEAAAYHTHMRRRVEALQRKHAEPNTASDGGGI